MKCPLDEEEIVHMADITPQSDSEHL